MTHGPLAQLVEHLTFNQVVPRSSRGWITKNMDGFPSGQREQTVNLSASLSVVRIHPRPPKIGKFARTCRFLLINYSLLTIHFIVLRFLEVIGNSEKRIVIDRYSVIYF